MTSIRKAAFLLLVALLTILPLLAPMVAYAQSEGSTEVQAKVSSQEATPAQPTPTPEGTPSVDTGLSHHTPYRLPTLLTLLAITLLGWCWVAGREEGQ